MLHTNGHSYPTRPQSFADIFPHHRAIPSERIRQLQELIHNFSLSRDRFLQALTDPRRDVRKECGLPDIITPEMYQDAYDRNALAKRVVEFLPKECAQTPFRVYETEDSEDQTPFELALDNLNQQLRGRKSWRKTKEGSSLQKYVLDADIQSRIGRYGVILIGTDDKLSYDQPAAGVEENGSGEKASKRQYSLNVNAKQTKGRKLLYLRVFPESLATIMQFEANESSPRYCQPTQYQITFGDPRQYTYGTGMPTGTKVVHWTRVVHVCESHVFHTPVMQAVFDNLVGAKQTLSADAEAYFKNCLLKMIFTTQPERGGVDIDVTSLKDMMEEFGNGLQNWAAFQDLNVQTVGPQIADPNSHIDAHIKAICIEGGYPQRAFEGSEQAQLASGQDRKTNQERVKQRRYNHVADNIVEPLTDRLIMLGVLPEPPEGYHIDFPEEEILTPQEQSAVQLSTVQTITAYEAGAKPGLARLDFWTLIMGKTQEEAEAIIKNAEEEAEKEKQKQQDAQIQAGLQQVAQGAPPPGLEQGGVPSPDVPGGEGGAGKEAETFKGEPTGNVANAGNNCGIAEGGFQHGNVCAKGGSGGTSHPDEPKGKGKDDTKDGKKPSLISRMKSTLAKKYHALEDRYGKAGAVAIAAGMAAMAPVPIPGAMLVPVGIAEGFIAGKHAVKKVTGNEDAAAGTSHPDVTNADDEEAGKGFKSAAQRKAFFGKLKEGEVEGEKKATEEPTRKAHDVGRQHAASVLNKAVEGMARASRDPDAGMRSPSDQRNYLGAFERAVGAIPPAAQQEIAANLKSVNFAGSSIRVERVYAKVTGREGLGNDAAGVVGPDGDVVLDGKFKHGIYEHELGHVLDKNNSLSHSDEWLKAWQKEVAWPDNVVLSNVARSSPSEGFAEFARAAWHGRTGDVGGLMLGGKAEVTLGELRSRFPMMSAYFEKRGYLPKDTRPVENAAMSSQLLDDVLALPTVLSDGTIIDRFSAQVVANAAGTSHPDVPRDLDETASLIADILHAIYGDDAVTLLGLSPTANADCGTGAGGFKPGNTCSAGGTSDEYEGTKLGSPEFKRWFGVSKIVDESGRPLTVYQGGKPTDVYNPAHVGEYGIYLTPRKKYAKQYADAEPGGKVTELLVSIQNPKVVVDKSEISPRDLTKADVDRLIGEGYDGIVAVEPGQPMSKATEIVAFRSSQVKHAHFNSGDFNPDDDNINNAAKWDSTQHPRSQTSGRFIPRGSPEAVATARTAIGRAIKGDRSPEDAHDLLNHLSILTVKQLREIQSEHGVLAAGPLRDHLVAGIKSRLEAPKADSTAPPKNPAPGKVYNVATKDLHVDPERFQFKLGTEAGTGVTQELKQVKTWNPDFAGVVSVWKDPADGNTYIVNGHHRHELAARLGVNDMAVRYITANSAKEARAVGALINIAEGRGTAVDAAKFMRDANATPADLEARGVSLKGKLAQDAAHLTRLSDSAFNRLATGRLDEGKALAVAKHLEDHDLQDQLFRILDRGENEGKDFSTRVIEEMSREMASTPKRKAEGGGGGLFKDYESEESLFVQRAEVKAHVRAALAREVEDFAAVSSKRRAERVAEAGNILDTERNRELAKEANRMKNIFDHLVNRRGVISDAINEAAVAYAAATTKRERDVVKQRAVEAARVAVFTELGVNAAGTGPGDHRGTSSSGDERHPGTQEVPADARRGDAGEDGLTENADDEEAGKGFASAEQRHAFFGLKKAHEESQAKKKDRKAEKKGKAAKSSPRVPKVGETVRVDGASYVAEPFDGDDTFPPAIASYEVKDGHIFYKGRDGSEGVVTGTPEQAGKWMRDVQEEVARHPPADAIGRAWRPADGGEENVKAATDMVGKAAKTFGVKPPSVNPQVVKNPLVGGEYAAGSLSLSNPHLSNPNESLNFKTSHSQEIHIAAHEMVHAAFSANPSLGHKYIQRLKDSGEKVSLYHALAGNFEGLMDLGGAYVHSPDELKQYSPELYDIADGWAKESKRVNAK